MLCPSEDVTFLFLFALPAKFKASHVLCEGVRKCREIYTAICYGLCMEHGTEIDFTFCNSVELEIFQWKAPSLNLRIKQKLTAGAIELVKGHFSSRCLVYGRTIVFLFCTAHERTLEFVPHLSPPPVSGPSGYCRPSHGFFKPQS